jgi:predicted enzyme related to lactoylglutathione lyase
MISNVKLMGVCVKDQQQALDFYHNVLGFEVVVNEPMGRNARWIEVAPAGAETRLALYTPPGLEDRIGTFSQIVFKCKDIQATYEELRQRGVQFTQSPTDQPGGTMAQFVDPDGNSFVLRG